MADPVSYAAVTPRIGMPMLFAGQSQKETTVNESLIILDMLIGSSVQGVRSEPPATPSAGDIWIVGNFSTGAFAGRTDALAGWSEGGWRFVQPSNGFRVQDAEAGATRVFADGWQLPQTPHAPTGGAIIDSEARETIAKILAALSDAGIFSQSS